MNQGLFLSLQERGLVQDFVPGLDALLEREKVAVYAGFDPTADSLHIGNLVPIMLLVHFQRAGHRPIALVGGATGRVGDPTGRSAERNVLSREQMEHHLACQQAQLKRFLDFDPQSPAAARLVNNEEWFGTWSFLDFIADVGRHIPINYMLAKDSVKLRLENGMSFMEFCYQLIQGYDFVHLHRHYGCKVQVGGSDQWGNITTGDRINSAHGWERGLGPDRPSDQKIRRVQIWEIRRGQYLAGSSKNQPLPLLSILAQRQRRRGPSLLARLYVVIDAGNR